MFRPPSKLALGLATAALAIVASVAGAPSASAFIFNDSSVAIDQTDLNQSFTIFFDGNVNGANVADLSSEATFTFLGFNYNRASTEATFKVTLGNTSTGGITSRTSALGFNVDGVDVIDANPAPSELFSNAVLNDSLPNSFGNIGVCFTGGNTCADGQNTGVDNDRTTANLQQDSFTATLDLAGTVSSFAVSNFGVRYQSINGNGYVGESGTGQFRVQPTSDSTSIPEPGTVSAILFAGVAMLSYRRKKVPAAQ